MTTQKISLEEYYRPALNENRKIMLKTMKLQKEGWKMIEQLDPEVERFKPMIKESKRKIKELELEIEEIKKLIKG